MLQRCWAHKTRNVLDKVKKKDQLMVKKALNRISHAANRREAIEAYWRFSSRWRKAYPKAVACLKKDLDQLLSFFQIKNSQLWSRLRTTNLIERAFREVRRSTRPMGVMAHTQSLQRIVFAVFHHLNQNWRQQPLKFTHPGSWGPPGVPYLYKNPGHRPPKRYYGFQGKHGFASHSVTRRFFPI